MRITAKKTKLRDIPVGGLWRHPTDGVWLKTKQESTFGNRRCVNIETGDIDAYSDECPAEPLDAELVIS